MSALCGYRGVSGDVPVDARNDTVLRKRRRNILPPDGAVRLMPLVRRIEGVVEGADEQDQVAQEGRDFEHGDGLRRVLLAPGEGVHCI